MKRFMFILLAPLIYTLVGIALVILMIFFLLAAGSMTLLHATPTQFLPPMFRTLRSSTLHYEPRVQ